MLKKRAHKKLKLVLFISLGALVGASSFGLISCTAATSSDVVGIELESVVDGDTINAKIGSENHSLRIQGIDTPESHEAVNQKWITTSGAQKLYADEATEYAKTLLTNKKLTSKIVTTDHYGRYVVRLFADAVDFAVAMVKKGLARVFYISIDPSQQTYYTSDYAYVAQLYEAQSEAYLSKRGIWSTPSGYRDAFPGS